MIRLVVVMYVCFSLSLRNVEDLLFERGIDICHEAVRMWWNRFGQIFAGDIRRQRVSAMRGFRHWRWHLDEIYVKLNGKMVHLWRALDHEGEILESYIIKTRGKDVAPRERAMLRFRQMKTLQKFARVHANVHNHFNLELLRVDRQIYKERCAAALAEWSKIAS
ncbi:DDE-type integrase/transposase/recombinase [Sphingomonas sp. GB1N7]|uniref:DDE-type integrase/transposase/recombinase n=1 Tax=Parasphingomonas caseinilytica TaxID=3096158 RepID=UPI002FC82906